MPRQFMNRGDKLVFSNGIIGLAIVAIVVLVVFRLSDTVSSLSTLWVCS